MYHKVVPAPGQVSLEVFMEAALDACRDRFGPVPRRFDAHTRQKLAVELPQWLAQEPDHPLYHHLKNLGRLWATGELVWGHIVQANRLLFDPNDPHNCPAEVVYSAQPGAPVHPPLLAKVAHELYSLKSTRPKAPSLRAIADHLTDEHTHRIHWTVPPVLNEGQSLAMGGTFIVRDHLPLPSLNTKWMPMVLAPEPPRYVMPLPAIFWPKRLLSVWSQKHG